MPLKHRQSLFRWVSGLLGSTLLVWVSAPWYLDSILLRQADPQLHTVTWQPGTTVHWRSEGFGTTRIGEHGFPGWTPPEDFQAAQPSSTATVILWGDSQVEGFCVDDPNKLFAQCRDWMQERGRVVDFIPSGRSGSDARHWLQGMPTLDQLYHPACHLWVVAELNDLTSLLESGDAPQPVASGPWIRALSNAQATAVFHAGRNMLIDRSTGERRWLDWRLVPRSSPPVPARQPIDQAAQREQTDRLVEITRQAAANTPAKLALVYAPAVPRMTRQVEFDDPQTDQYEQIRDALAPHGIAFVDVRPAFNELYREHGELPRGFHNGFPGMGHLNEHGNRLIAQAIGRWLIEQGRATTQSAP